MFDGLHFVVYRMDGNAIYSKSTASTTIFSTIGAANTSTAIVTITATMLLLPQSNNELR